MVILDKRLHIALIVGAISFLPLGYALGQTQKEGDKEQKLLQQKVDKSTKVDLAQTIKSKSFKHERDGQTFTCMPPVEGSNELPLFMTAGYCQNLCGNDTPVYVANWQGTGQSLCYCSVKNKTYIY